MGNIAVCCKKPDENNLDRNEVMAAAMRDADLDKENKFEGGQDFNENQPENNFNYNNDYNQEKNDNNLNPSYNQNFNDNVNNIQIENKEVELNGSNNPNPNPEEVFKNQSQNPDIYVSNQQKIGSQNMSQNYSQHNQSEHPERKSENFAMENQENPENPENAQNVENVENPQDNYYKPETDQIYNSQKQNQNDYYPKNRQLGESDFNAPGFKKNPAEPTDEEVEDLLEKLLKRNKIKDDIDFDNNGWQKFYPPEEEFFHYDHGNDNIRRKKVTDPEHLDLCEVYEGETNKQGEKHGLGVLTTCDSIKRGDFRHDQFTGWGREAKSNGDVIEARFIDGVVDGKGTFKNAKGNVYTGDFVNGKRQGYGSLTTNKFHYEGEFADDKLNGNGKIQFLQQGHEYAGDFKNNEINGYGTFKWKNGDYYEGEMSNGKMHGRGKYTYNDGQVYEGEYVNGLKEGKGKLTYPSGKIYEGDFKNGLPDGLGKFTKDGKTSDVEFSKGKFKRSLMKSSHRSKH